MAEKHVMDRFRELVEEIHGLIATAEELSYEQGLYMEHAFRCEADWIHGWLTHEATLGVVNEHRERLEAHLELYRQRDRLDRGEDWDPNEELG